MYTKGDLEIFLGSIAIFEGHMSIEIGGPEQARALILDLREKIKKLEEKLK